MVICTYFTCGHMSIQHKNMCLKKAKFFCIKLTSLAEGYNVKACQSNMKIWAHTKGVSVLIWRQTCVNSTWKYGLVQVSSVPAWCEGLSLTVWKKLCPDKQIIVSVQIWRKGLHQFSMKICACTKCHLTNLSEGTLQFSMEVCACTRFISLISRKVLIQFSLKIGACTNQPSIVI